MLPYGKINHPWKLANKASGMVRWFFFSLMTVCLLTSNALGGLGSGYSSPYSADSIVAPVLIKDKGLYNLVVSIQFLNEPYDRKMYKSDAYENFIRRLKVEWSGVAILQILKSKEQSVNDLAGLKGIIETEIAKLANQLKKKYSLGKDVEVVFSLSNFFILEAKDV